MNIWLVNPFDPLAGESLRPGRYAFLADLLANKGHRITWWTSDFFHFTKSFRNLTENKPNLKIMQLSTPGYKDNVSLRRIWNHYIYAKKFDWKAKQSETPPDIIIASCPPLSSAKVAIKVAKKLGTKCVIDIQDLWPEAFEMVFPSKMAKVFFYPMKRRADNIYSSADALMAVSQTYIRRALSICNNDKVSFVLYLGIDLKLFDEYNESNSPVKKNEDEFWVTYIGTIGRSYDIKTILDAANLLKPSHKNIRFFIAGDGPQLAQMKKTAEDKNLTNCKFLGLLKFEDMVGLLRQSDTGLNAIVENTKTSFPNKVFDYMAGGLAIVNSVQGELEELLESENIGVQYKAGNAISLKNAILELYNNPEKWKEMGENARRLVEERFDKNKTYPEIEKFLQDVVGYSKNS